MSLEGADICTAKRFFIHEDKKTFQCYIPIEEAIAISINGSSYAVMMATPCDIEDFAVGFALSENIIKTYDEIHSVEIIKHNEGYEIQLWLDESLAENIKEKKRALAGPVGCGLCGVESLEEAIKKLPFLDDEKQLNFHKNEIANATDMLRGLQPLHDLTHGVHAAGFIIPQKGIVIAREDVGRHNALDKLIGALHKTGIDPSLGSIVLTSRVSVEMVQKTAIFGAAMIIAVSTPTSLAIKKAKQANITLIANAKKGLFEVFCGENRLKDK